MDTRREARLLGRARWVIGALALLVTVLAVQNRALAGRSAELLAWERYPQASLLLPTFESTTDGVRLTIGEAGAGRRQLLLFFTRRCTFCQQSVPAWRTLAALAATDSTLEIAAVTLDSLAHGTGWMRQQALAVPVVRFPSPKWRLIYRVNAVPLTVLLDARGQIEFAHVGALVSGVMLDSLQRVLASPNAASARDRRGDRERLNVSSQTAISGRATTEATLHFTEVSGD